MNSHTLESVDLYMYLFHDLKQKKKKRIGISADSEKKKDKNFSRYSRKFYFDYITPHQGLDLENGKPIFSHDNTGYADALPYRIYLQKG